MIKDCVVSELSHIQIDNTQSHRIDVRPRYSICYAAMHCG